MLDCDVIVAGAGIWGCTIARRLAGAGKKVLVLEKRSVVGGNVRSEIDSETGIEIHTYGSHIFHTHIPEVWAFVNRFIMFNGYQHKVLANYKGRIYNLPLGLPLINKFFNVELKPSEVLAFLDDPNPEEVNIHCPPPPTISTSGMAPRRQALFDAFFRGYTSKQWGKAPEDIDPTIIKRVPVRNNYDINYFNDYNQGIPTTGYNSLFDRLLDHPNISVETEMVLKLVGADLRAARNPDSTQPPLEIDCAGKAIYYSGPIDALFDYKFGALPWRTLRFETETLDMQDYQGTSVVNYPDIDVPYTRIHEFKHYHPEARGQVEKVGGGGERPLWGFDSPKTVIMRECSDTWKPGDEPYYPVNTPESQALLAQYQKEVERINNPMSTTTSNLHLIIGGRLGNFKYLDMDQSMASALKVEI